MFAIDQYELVAKKMEKHVYEERLQYNDIYNTIEDYIVKANSTQSLKRDTRIIIGGSMGVNLLLERERTFRDFQYVLYTENSLVHANSLTNEIAKIIASLDKKWVVKMKSSIPDIKYEIYVDNRPMVTMYTLKSDPVKTYDLIEPVTVKSFDGKKQLIVLSPEMYLLDVYRTLYLPSDVGSWEDTLVDEQHLFELLQKRLSILGGANDLAADRSKIENALLEHYVCDNNKVVLVGEHAFKVLANVGALPTLKNMQMSSNVIYVLSAMSEEESFNKIKDIVRKATGRDIPVTKHTKSSNVMQDFRLQRTTIKIGADNDQKEIMYIYNSPSFDLIPFNTVKNNSHTIQVGNPFVLMRFLLIDLWVIRWVREMKKVNEFFAKKRISNILHLIVTLRTAINCEPCVNKIKDEFFASDDKPLNVFQRDRYIGVYVDEGISMRQQMMHQDRRYVDYFPASFFFKNKSYRVFY